MNKIGSITNLWQNVRETDLRPFRDQALRGINIAIVGEPNSGGEQLADQMRRDPNRPQLSTDTPLLILDLDSADRATPADLIILMVPGSKTDTSREQELALSWQNKSRHVLVFINQTEAPAETQAISAWANVPGRRIVTGSPADTQFLMEKFVPAVIEFIPAYLLPLGRYFPLFRLKIAHYLINDTSFSNAAYSMSTGFAEIVAVLDIPITLADTIILTKSQAFLVYKLGLALGYSTRWQDYLTEFGGVLGGGFVWRQIARSLVGLIPVWGILPKTAISYAGTYVVGNVVLQWYLTGRHVSKKQMQQIYSQAFLRGKTLARSLAARLPRPHLPRLRLPRLARSSKNPRLPAPKKQKKSKRLQVCPNCGKTSAKDASFCQYCGTHFSLE